jgi:membrane protein YqaA with SNARE-associated domain
MDEATMDKLKIVGALLVFIVFAYVVFANASLVRELSQGYGLLGLFIASIIANATVLLPMPIDLVVLAISLESSSLPEVVFISGVVGAGAAIGEMTAYMAGLLGVQTAEKIKESEFKQIGAMRERIERLGMSFIFFMAVIPLPFDIIGITAGFIRYNPKKFFVAALFGKMVRFAILGLAGYYSVGYVKALGF